MQDNQLGSMLRTMRESRQLSRARFAHMAGLTAACLARFEDGEAPVPATVLGRVAIRFGVPLSAMFPQRATAMTPRADMRGMAIH